MARKATTTKRVLGQRVVESVVPRYFRNQTALQIATGFAFSTVNDWARGKADPRYEQLEKIVEAIRREHGETVDPIDLLRGRVQSAPEPARFRNLPWWSDVVAKARELFPRTPAYAFEWLGSLMGEEPPPPDPVVLGSMAAAWHQRASDQERSDAIVAKAEREMAEEDAAPANDTAPTKPPAAPKPTRKGGG